MPGGAAAAAGYASAVSRDTFLHAGSPQIPAVVRDLDAIFIRIGMRYL